MATIHALIRTDYLNKNGEDSYLLSTPIKKRWRVNTEIKVNPEIFQVEYDEDTELYRLTGSSSMKREQLSQYNSLSKLFN